MLKIINTPGTPLPKCLIVFVDADLQERSRYCVVIFFGGAPVWIQSKLQPSSAYDITDAESYAYSIGSIMGEVTMGRLEDMGYAALTADGVFVVGDNDATLRIAADAASAKRGLHIARRVAHTRYLTTQGRVRGLKVVRDYNYADAGTHYVSRTVAALFDRAFRGD